MDLTINYHRAEALAICGRMLDETYRDMPEYLVADRIVQLARHMSVDHLVKKLLLKDDNPSE